MEGAGQWLPKSKGPGSQSCLNLLDIFRTPVPGHPAVQKLWTNEVFWLIRIQGVGVA